MVKGQGPCQDGLIFRSETCPLFLRFLFFGVALLIWGLVGAAVWAGWFPALRQRIYRSAEPGTFWTTMALGLIFGALFVHIGFFV